MVALSAEGGDDLTEGLGEGVLLELGDHLYRQDIGLISKTQEFLGNGKGYGLKAEGVVLIGKAPDGSDLIAIDEEYVGGLHRGDEKIEAAVREDRVDAKLVFKGVETKPLALDRREFALVVIPEAIVGKGK